MDPNTDHSDDPFDVAQPAADLSALDDSPPDLGPALGDDEALRKMGSGTSILAWVALIGMIVGVGAIGWVLWQRMQAEEHRWDAYNEAQEQAADQEDFLRRIRELLPDAQYDDVKLRILGKMEQYRDAASVPVIAAQLDSGSPTVVTAAAHALSAIGSPSADVAKPDLMRALERTPSGQRAPIVWALAVLGESAAADAIIAEFSSGRLQGQPGFDPRVISEVLGPERLSSNDLLNHDEVSVRTLTASALAESASPDVIDPLSRMADFELARPEPDQNVLRSIASGLGRAGDQRAGTPLFHILEAQPRMRAAVLDALRRTTGAPGITALLGSAHDDDIKLELVRMLAASHDPQAAEPLATFIDSENEQLRQEAAFGLAELGDQRAVPGLLRIAQGLDLQVAREALSKIQALRAPSAADTLSEMLRDERFLSRRANILRALGTTGNTAAGPAIEHELEGDDVAAAAAALADLDYDPAYDRLARMIPRGDTDFSVPSVANETAFMNRTAAVRALGRYGRPDVAEAFMTIIEDPLDDRRLRHDAGLALGAIASEEVLQQIIAKVQDANLDEVAKRYYVSSLWQRASAEVAAPLMDLIANSETPPDVRRAAALAVGYAAPPSLDDRVHQFLEEESTRREAAFMIVLGGSEANARALLNALAGDEELQQVILYSIRDDESNAFNLVTSRNFESGEVTTPRGGRHPQRGRGRQPPRLRVEPYH
ncbi:MAG: HEAT repeat domain-containing protein, partial [Sandaracinaceae bacterium]